MFVLTTISDLVRITPQDFRKPSIEAIEDNINRKYANKVIQNVGLCICFWELLKASEGLIGQSDGMVNVNVVFRAIVFRPFKGEIIQGVILEGSTAEGLRIGLDFFSDIWIPGPGNLFEGSRFTFRDDEHVWIWTTEDGTEFFYDRNEPVRFRVEAEVWHDHTPQKPKITGLTSSEGTENDESLESRDVPYTIIGSMDQAGLGPIVWWEEAPEEEEDAMGGVDEMEE
ncbi:hypothetical protein EJ06DRAFT_498800 [Trichodelitschia bisporula]|uniref:DNA-directed RNA polymerase subunit n=1 Tax=Trichodelitschia bisporula TaxID=703511 RepID=A0A6G1HPB7_9PEZI|nr:hypothetical protein EJ06DRAFT_498800 [Trichodelitschia bisporula]